MNPTILLPDVGKYYSTLSSFILNSQSFVDLEKDGHRQAVPAQDTLQE